MASFGPQPQKRPRSSWKSFCAEQPKERWQTDITHWQLADGTEAAILNILDDHSRLAVGSHARRNATGADVVASFPQSLFTQWGIPAGVRSDNGAVFTAKQRGDGRVALEVELGVLGVKFSHSRPYHPQTCGKIERLHQTQKKWLAAQPTAATITALQRQLDRFCRLLQHPSGPTGRSAGAPRWRPTSPAPKPSPPASRSPPTTGSATTPSTPAAPSPCATTAGYTTSASAPYRRGTRVTLLVDDLHIRVIGRDTGELIRKLTLDPNRGYKPRGLPPGPPKKKTDMQRCPKTSHSGA